jgi:predicted flap endonuclease-1-like 5' DNA nuclease
MSYPIEKIKGLTSENLEKLNAQGITFTKEFLNAAATPKGRTELSTKTGIEKELILKWANHCDLMRIPGIGFEEADILEKIGVDTILELAKRKPENLHTSLDEYLKKTSGRWYPDLETVQKWILYAGNRTLFQRILKY